MECSFFSSDTNHWGARWTFLRSTHLQGEGSRDHTHMTTPTHIPDLDAEEIAFSAKLNPSEDPIAMEVHCLPSEAARSSTRPLASYPVTEHRRMGVLDLT